MIPRAKIRLRRPGVLPTSADDGEPILIRAPKPRLYLGAGGGVAPQPLTVGREQVEGLPDLLAGKADLVDGKILPAQLPALRTVQTWTVWSAEEMLALPGAIPGDYAVRMDRPEGYRHYVLAGDPSTAPMNWVPIESPQPSKLGRVVSNGAQAIPLPERMVLLALQAAHPCRVRIYRGVEGRDLDTARPVSVDPPDAVGCLAEAVLTPAALAVVPPVLPVVSTGGQGWVLVEPAGPVTLDYLEL